MAYLLPKTEQMIQQGAGQTNIFDGQEQGGQQAQQPMQQQSSQQDSSEIAPAGGGTSAPGLRAAPPMKQSQGAVSKKNEIANSGVGSNIGQNIARARNQLQSEADAYQANMSKSYNIGQNEIEKGIAGDPEWSAKVRDLSLGTGLPEQAPAFVSNANLNTGADQFQNIQGLLRGRGGSQYSGGEAQLDAALLGKNKEFQLDKNRLMNEQKSLIDQANKARGLTESVNEANKANYDTARAGLRGYLKGQEQLLRGANITEAEAEAKARETAQQQYLDSLDPEIAKRASENFINPLDEKFVQFGTANPAWTQMMDQGEVDRYRGIMNLLGGGGVTPLEQGDMGGARFTPTGNALEESIKSSELGRKNKLSKALEDVSSGSSWRAMANTLKFGAGDPRYGNNYTEANKKGIKSQIDSFLKENSKGLNSSDIKILKDGMAKKLGFDNFDKLMSSVNRKTKNMNKKDNKKELTYPEQIAGGIAHAGNVIGSLF